MYKIIIINKRSPKAVGEYISSHIVEYRYNTSYYKMISGVHFTDIDYF